MSSPEDAAIRRTGRVSMKTATPRASARPPPAGELPPRPLDAIPHHLLASLNPRAATAESIKGFRLAWA